MTFLSVVINLALASQVHSQPISPLPVGLYNVSGTSQLGGHNGGGLGQLSAIVFVYGNTIGPSGAVKAQIVGECGISGCYSGQKYSFNISSAPATMPTTTRPGGLASNDVINRGTSSVLFGLIFC